MDSDEITPFPSPASSYASLPSDDSSWTTAPPTGSPTSADKKKKVNIKQLIQDLPPPAETPDESQLFPTIWNRKHKQDVTDADRKEALAAKTSANEHFRSEYCSWCGLCDDPL